MSRITKRNLLVLILIVIIIFGTVYNYDGNKVKDGNSKIEKMNMWNFLQEKYIGLPQIIPDYKSDITRNETINNEILAAEVQGKQHSPDSMSKKRPTYNTKTIKQDSSNKQECQPRTNIAFFKMHKCSSSTVQNILFRYGDERNLNFVLPISGNYLGNDLFNKRHMLPFPTKEYNIICHHTRFSYRGMQEVLPADAAFVTIIRDPVTMFESTFTYNHLDVVYGINHFDDPLGTFLENPEMYYSTHGSKKHAKNPMMYDLGLQIDDKENINKIDKMIKELSGQFDLVMITEYFDESLILLKELMCWEMDDIIYFVLNARAFQSVREVTPENVIKIRNWNAGDFKLYKHFNQTFWGKVKKFGKEKMTKEVAKLNKRIEYYRKLCIDSVTYDDKKVWHPAGIKVKSFRLKPSAIKDKNCIRLVRTELPYSDFLRHKQIIKFRNSQ